MYPKRPSLLSKRRGITLVWVAISGLLFVGFVGLAADTSYVYLTAEQLQWVSDASALAGARICATEVSPYTQTRNTVVNLAASNKAGGMFITLARNDANDPAGEVVVGRYSTSTHVFTEVPPSTLTPNAVKVVAKRTDGSLTGNLPLIFGRVFGTNYANISRDATAMITGTGAGLIVLNLTDSQSFDMGGNSSLTIAPVAPQTCDDGAGIQVNSSAAADAAYSGNSTTIVTTVLGVNGGYSGAATLTAGACPGSGADLIDQHNGIVLPDPLGCSGGTCVPEPIPSNFTIRASPSNSADAEILPGWYQNGLQRTGGQLIMRPGVYIIGNNQNNNNNTLQLNGNSKICGKGIMFFIKAGQVQITGGSGLKQLDPIKLNPPSNYFCDPAFTNPGGLDAKWDGIIIFQSRSNTSDAQITGSSSLQMTGTVYFPKNLVRVGGNGFSLGTQVICDKFALQGNSSINISYDGRNPANGIGKAVLVE